MKCNYVFEGAGDKTIVFIHGLSDSLDYWEVLSSNLSDEYRILRYDLRGHGNTELGSESVTMDVMVDDLYGLLRELDIERASLIGLSLGGNIALNFAVMYPEMVENLVIMSSASEVDSNLHSKFIEFRDAVSIGFEEFYDVIIRYVIPDDIFEKNYEALQEIKHSAAGSANLEGIRAGIEMGINFNVTDELDKIDAPTLILAGRDDDIIDLNLQYILRDNIKNSELIIFDDTKHNLLIGNNIPEILKLIRQLI